MTSVVLKPSLGSLLYKGLMGGLSVCCMMQCVAAGTYYVATNGTDVARATDPDAGSSGKPFRTIQFAVDEAEEGATVRVRPGVYDSGFYVDGNGQTNRVYIDKGLRLESTGGAAVTHIVGRKDSSNAYGLGSAAIRCVYVNKYDTSVVISGFTIRDGATSVSGTTDGALYRGGGVCYKLPDEAGGVLNECVVSNCAAAWGGGVSGGVLTRCLVADNFATVCGSAANGGRLYNCVITRNCGLTSSTTHSALRNPVVVAQCTIVCNGVRGAYSGTNDRYSYNNLIAANAASDYGFTKVDGCLSGDAAMFSVVSTVDDWRLVTGTRAATCAKADYLKPFDKRNGGFFEKVPAAVVSEFMTKDFYGNSMPTADEVAAGKNLCAGAVQDVVTPAGGATYFAKAGGECRFAVDGFPAAYSFWAFPMEYPRQYVVRTVVDPGYFVLRMEQTPETAARCMQFPNDDGEFAVIAPPTFGLVVTNAVSYCRVVHQAWVDCEKGNDASGAIDDEAHPYASIQAAVDAASNGTFINVLPGVYSNKTSTLFNAPCRVACTSAKDVYIRSTDGAERTVILGTSGKGADVVRCVALQDRNVVRGFTLAGAGWNTSGGYADQGCAFFANGPKGYLIDCIVSNNVAGGYVTSGGILTRCRIVNNSTSAYICNGQTLNACVVADNEAPDGNATVASSTVLNSTFANNRGGREFHRTAAGVETCTVVNSIAVSDAIASPGGTFLRSLVWNYPSFAPTEDAVSADPLVTKVVDYRPMASSPAYALGGDLTAPNPPEVWRGATLDIDGRPIAISDSGRIALGAYSTPTDKAVVRLTAAQQGLAVTGGTLGENLLAAGASLELRPQAGSRPCAGVVVNGVTNLFADTLPVVLTAAQASTAGGLDVTALYSADWYVDDDGAAGNSGMSPNDAKNSFAELFKTGAVVSGDTVHVLPGTYSEGTMFHRDGVEIASRLVIPSGVTVRSTEGAEKTIIKGRLATTPETFETYASCGCGAGAERCAYLNSGSKLIGFTLTDGRTRCNLSGDMGNNHDAIGGGVFGTGYDNAVPPATYVADCIISNNAAYRGGGARNVTLVNCRIADNRGYYGGSAASDCSLLSCVVKGNVDYKYNRPVFQFSMVKSSSVFDSIQGAISANSRITDSYLHGWSDNGRATYQRCVFREESGVDPTLVDETCRIVPEAELVFDEEGRPVVGANVLIDAGDPHVLPELAAGHDASGGPRVTNGFLDFGALEADWTARYAADLGRRVTVTAVRGTVRDPGTRTVGIYTGGLDLSWEQLKIGDKGLLDVEVTGAGELVATVNGVEIGRVRAVAGRTTLPFVSTQLVDAISIVYLPDATDDVDPATAAGPCAIVYGLKRDAGLVLIVR